MGVLLLRLRGRGSARPPLPPPSGVALSWEVVANEGGALWPWLCGPSKQTLGGGVNAAQEALSSSRPSRRPLCVSDSQGHPPGAVLGHTDLKPPLPPASPPSQTPHAGDTGMAAVHTPPSGAGFPLDY